MRTRFARITCKWCKMEVLRTKGKKGACFCNLTCFCNFQNARKRPPGKRTKPEKEVADILKELGIPYKEQYHNPYMKTWRMFDFYLPDRNVLIEVDGTYWHAKNVKEDKLSPMQKRAKKNDKVKNALAKDHGFTLVRVWEDEISKPKIKKLINA